MAFALPDARRVLRDLSQQELLERTLEMPTARTTSYGAPNVQTPGVGANEAFSTAS